MIGRLQRRRAGDRIAIATTSIGAGSTVTGNLKGADNCVVYGRFVGDCVIDGSVIIGTDAHWQGNIIAEHVIIAGKVQGDITVRTQLELLATAQVTGRLSCLRIAIADGAIHAGQVQMSAETEIVHFRERRSADTPVPLNLSVDDG